MEGRCPDTFYCSNGTHGYSAIKPSLLLIPAYAALVSSSLSCLGAALIVCAYCAFKDLRKGTTQTIITLLALADLGSAVTGILGAGLFIGYDNLVQKSEKECYIFDTICQIQGFMTLSSQFCGLIWTSILAIHLILVTTFNRSTWINKLLPVYNIVAWMIPLIATLPSLFLDEIGYNPDTRWTCFLRWHTSKGILYLWLVIELLNTAMVFIGYTVILVYVSCKQTCRIRNPTAWRINKRILIILVAYIILRLPDTVQLISSIFTHNEACLDDHTQFFEFIKTTLEAVADTSQGWVNCVLYIFLSPEMRRRMFVLPFRRALNKCRRLKVTQRLSTSEIDPLLGNTQNSFSAQGLARERGDTYLSYATEFPEASRNQALSVHGDIIATSGYYSH